VLSGRRESLFAARRPLRAMAGDLGVRFKEATIHASRMRAVMDAHEILPIPGDVVDPLEMQQRVENSMMLRSPGTSSMTSTSPTRRSASGWPAKTTRSSSTPSRRPTEACLVVDRTTSAGGCSCPREG
jgi:hypothetical protein